MAKDFMIITDITSDLPKSYYEANNVRWALHGLVFEDQQLWDEFGTVITHQAVMEKCRAKVPISTLQVRLEDFEAMFTQAAQAGQDAMFVSFSSAMSGTYGTACIAADMVREKYPQCDIHCVDTLAASLGQSLLVREAVRLRSEGFSAAETARELERLRLKVCHFFTVDDLFHLFRGGRLSRTSATVGSLMGIKPVMYISDEGKLTPLSKMRGRKAAIQEVARLTARYITDTSQTVYINHGDSEDDARELAHCVQAAVPGVKVELGQLSPVIGVHSGPGTLSIFFWGEKRI